MIRLVTIILCVLSLNADMAEQPMDTTTIATHSTRERTLKPGRVTQPTEVPWHAAIYMPTPRGYELQCGGTLIAPTIVVTAAQCFIDWHTRRPKLNLNAHQVVLGKNHREYYVDVKTPHVQVLDVKRVEMYPHFDVSRSRLLEHDIAIVETTTSAVMTLSVRLATVALDLSHIGTQPRGSVGVVAGWGFNIGDVSNTLHSVTLPYVSHRRCHKSLKDDRLKQLLSADKFCAGHRRHVTSFCPGDVGSGYVVTEGRTNRLRGLASVDLRPRDVSQGGCHSARYLGFTDVQELRYVAWLREFLPARNDSMSTTH